MIFAALFVIFCCVCTLFAFTRHPIWGLYFYLAATFVFPPGRWWGYVFGGLRWSLLAAVVTALAILLHRNKLLAKPVWIGSAPAIVIATYAVWMWVQTPWAQDLSDHLEGSIRFAKYVLAFWFVYRIADTREHARDVLFAHMLGCALLGVFAYSMGRDGDRLDGVGGPGIDDGNTLGMYFATGAIVALGLILTQTGWRRWLSLVCVAIILEGLVLTNTRGAFLGLVAGAMALMLLKSKSHRRMFWALATVGLLGLASITDQKFIDRMWTIRDATSESENADASARSRMIVAQAQWRMFLDYPMGTGHRGTAALSARYIDERWLTKDATGESARSSHNTFLTALVEQGIPGALMFIWLSLWTVITVLRSRWNERMQGDADSTTLIAAIAAALAAVFVAGNTADFLMAEVQFWLFAALVSLLQFAAAERQTTSGVADATFASRSTA
jgi:O-Antigen ligase